ncbi:hypothetical protein PT2222_40242 [Paraburkholderia tropica]
MSGVRADKNLFHEPEARRNENEPVIFPHSEEPTTKLKGLVAVLSHRA